MQVINNIHAFIWQSMSANNCNTYLIDGPTRVLIDPGHRNLFDHVKKGLGEIGLTLEDIGLIVCTHGHPDHIEAAQLFKESHTLLTLHQKEWQFLKSMDQQIRAAIGINLDSISPDFFLNEGDISLNDIDLIVLHTPGHSPGSVSLYWPDQKLLFTGDLVFKEGLGRTDLPGGDSALLKESVKRLAELEVEWLLPGHGDIIDEAMDIKKNFNHLKQVWFNYI
jgi:glyoxylase-like metal-dependent hydrolase (beta-lactamase superfamily II)